MKLMPFTAVTYHQLISKGYTHLVRRYSHSTAFEGSEEIITYEAVKSLSPEKTYISMQSDAVMHLFHNDNNQCYVLIKNSTEEPLRLDTAISNL